MSRPILVHHRLYHGASQREDYNHVVRISTALTLTFHQGGLSDAGTYSIVCMTPCSDVGSSSSVCLFHGIVVVSSSTVMNRQIYICRCTVDKANHRVFNITDMVTPMLAKDSIGYHVLGNDRNDNKVTHAGPKLKL